LKFEARHSRESGNPVSLGSESHWVSAFAGTTKFFKLKHCLCLARHPAKAGIQLQLVKRQKLDPGLRWDDEPRNISR
jgi:hypothetical protein